MNCRPVPLFLSLALAVAASGAPVHELPVPGFGDPVNWSGHGDGGNPPALSSDTELGTPANPALRLDYTNHAPDWGNAHLETTVPATATALRFRLHVHQVRKSAAMYVWLLEADKDAWVQEIRIGQQAVGDLQPGDYDVELAVGGFRFEARGPGSPDMASCDGLLLGSNYNDLSVSVRDARWVALTTVEGVAELPRKRPEVARGPNGSAAVWVAEGLDTAGAADPGTMAATLREHGWGVALLQAGDLADPELLTPTNFDVVLLPYGSAFPAAARQTFVAYLKEGGTFLSTGGYAFDRQMVWNGQEWLQEGQGVTAAGAGREQWSMNTRIGRHGDTMQTQPDQIGVFDPAYLLRDATDVRTVPGPLAPPEDLVRRLRSTVPEQGFTGFAATCMNSRNSPVFPERWARYVPLLEATDRFGRNRGPLGAVLYHYAGPYTGSAWAFFGVENTDLFGAGDNSLLPWLPTLLDNLTRRVFLASFRAERVCVPPGGEPPELIGRVVNHGRGPRTVTVAVDGCTTKFADGSDSMVLEPGVSAELRGAWTRLQTDAPGPVVATATLHCDGVPVDRLQAGVEVWEPQAVDGRARFAFRDNYVGFGERARFLCGTNQTGMMFFTEDEDPAVWDRDFRLMAARGVRICRILHFSPFVKDRPGAVQAQPLDLAQTPPQELVDEMDAILAAAQRHGVTVFLTLHDWMDVELTDAELAAQNTWARFWAHRYREVPEVFFDIQNEPNVAVPDLPHVRELWNAWLSERHGSTEAAWRAWGQTGPVPDALVPEAGPGGWNDMQSVDYQWFRVRLLNRWTEANARGVRQGNPNAPCTVGYLPWMNQADKALGTRHLTFSNMHFYGDIHGLAGQFRQTDRRLVGKGLSLGEFGAQTAHDHRTHGRTGTQDEASIRRFLLTTHTAFGVGGAFACNWDWKDMFGAVFPWGANHQDGVPKPIMAAFRNMSLLLGAVEPVWQPPRIWMVLPNSYRVGPDYNRIHRDLDSAVHALMRCRVDFAVIDEHHLAETGRSPDILIWPLAYACSDEAFAWMEEHLHQGMNVLLTGDPSFGPDRTRSRSERLERLALDTPRDHDPLARPESELTADWSDVGQGRVALVPGPLERGPEDDVRAVYAGFLRGTGADVLPVHGGNDSLRVCSVRTADNGRVHLLLPSDEQQQTVSFGEGLECRLDKGLPGLIAIDSQGACVMLEQDTGTAGYAGIVSLDGLDVRHSQALLAVPFRPGPVVLPSEACREIDKALVLDFGPDYVKVLGEQPVSDGETEVSGALDVLVVATDAAREPALRRVRELWTAGLPRVGLPTGTAQGD